MKYLREYKLFERREDIHDICKKYSITNYTINDDGSIDVNGNVNMRDKRLTKLPLKFRNVSGYFWCYNNQLVNLEGSPQHVGGDFYCHDNQLTSLEGAPQSVGGYLLCRNNQLTSLEGAPQHVGRDFYCNDNQLTSLEGAPKHVGGYFYCIDNQLTSLEGAPQSVGGNLYFNNNQLTSLDGLEFKSFPQIDLENNPIYEVVNDWINRENREDLIEYFVDLGVVQDGETKPKLIISRLEAFYEDMNLGEIKINFEEVKKYYEVEYEYRKI